MPKAKRGIFEGFIEDTLNAVIESVGETSGELARRVGNVTKIKAIMIKYSLVLCMAITSFILIAIGISNFLSNVYDFDLGIVQIIIGLVILLIAIIYRRF